MRADRRAGVSPFCFLFFSFQQDLSIWASEEADKAFPLLDLLLNLVAGGGDLSLCREDGADEGEHSAAHGSVEGPAHGAEPSPVWSRIRAAVQLDLV